MQVKRILPCLDIRNGKVVKGKNFTGIRELADPAELAAFYDAEGADELVFYDITASVEGRVLFSDVLKRVMDCTTLPLTVGGGIQTLSDFERLLRLGVNKISVNSGALQNRDFIPQAAKEFGSNCVVFSMDVKRNKGRFEVFAQAGKKATGIDAVEWAKYAQASGAGELVINSIDTDGVKNGFDLELLKAIQKCVSVPIVASGGAGSVQDFITLFETLPQIDAGLAATIFHMREVRIPELKQKLKQSGIPVHI